MHILGSSAFPTMSTSKGRALPPRPSFLVGNAAACYKEWRERLKPDIQQFLHCAAQADDTTNTTSTASRTCWDDALADALVWRSRSMRESLVSNDMLINAEHLRGIAIEVYELSADLCAAARNHPELLKCLQMLVTELHPTAQQLGALRTSGCNSALQGSGVSAGHATAEQEASCRTESRPLGNQDGAASEDPAVPVTAALSSDAGPSALGDGRSAEFVAAQLLFFCCVLQRPVAQDVICVLRGAAVRQHLGHQHVLYSLKVLQALARHDASAFLRLASQPPTRLLQDLVDCKVEQSRCALVAALSVSYRTLPSPVVLDWLSLGQQERHQSTPRKGAALGPMPKLLQVLEQSAAGGCRGAKVALEALSQQPGLQETLVFKM